MIACTKYDHITFTVLPMLSEQPGTTTLSGGSLKVWFLYRYCKSWMALYYIDTLY